MIAPFSKKPFNVTLRGITTDELDLSVDLIRTVTLPQLKLFGIEDGLELKVKRLTLAVAGLCRLIMEYRLREGARSP